MAPPEDDRTAVAHQDSQPHQHQHQHQHETERCERAISMDDTRVDAPTKLGASLFWVAVSSKSAWSLVNSGDATAGLLHLLGLQDTPKAANTIAQALQVLLNGKALLSAAAHKHEALPLASIRAIKVALKAAAWILLAGLSYCPLGRLAFARPLRRLTIKLAAAYQPRARSDGLAQALHAFTAMAKSKHGLLALANALLLPGLQKLLALSQSRRTGPRAALASLLSTLVTSLRVILTVTSCTAAYTQLRPSHLIPSNPWKGEPAGMEYLRHNTLAHNHAAASDAAAPVPSSPIGVLVCNLGTTPTPKPKDVAEFLREFLMDPRVVEVSKLEGKVGEEC